MPAERGARAQLEPRGPERVPADLADPLLREIGAWLDLEVSPARVEAVSRGWDARTGAAARRLLAAHGLGPLLAGDPALAAVLAALPDELQAWLGLQAERNRARIDRLHAELGVALHALAAAGIAVMPLKSTNVAAAGSSDPYRRPMADLDLLVRPADRAAARAALERLGYRLRPERNRRPTHDTLLLVGNEDVVSFDGEHPDNPRSIELHVEVVRHLWAWADEDDLTALLWAGAREGTVLGERAILPAATAAFAHRAIHATSDMLTGRGRLIQWLDLAEAATAMSAGDPSGLPHPRLAYPALRLSGRRFENRLGGRLPDLAGLEAMVPERLIRWAIAVPLDTRTGLQSGRFGPADRSSFAARWQRWSPSSWRLAVAYGDLPRPIAAARHAWRLARIAGAPKRPA